MKFGSFFVVLVVFGSRLTESLIQLERAIGTDVDKCSSVECHFMGPFIDALVSSPQTSALALEVNDLGSCLAACRDSDRCTGAEYSPASHFAGTAIPRCRLHETAPSRTGTFSSIPEFDYYVRKKPGLELAKLLPAVPSAFPRLAGNVNGTSLREWVAAELPKIPKTFMDPLSLVLDAPGLVPRDALIVEAGVFRGRSINQIARKRPTSKIFGMDSFVGLPEDWHFDSVTNRTMPKELFSLNGNFPFVEGNVNLIKGWFAETLPLLVAMADVSKRSRIDLLHVDCDLYSSTSQVLTRLSDRLQPGTVIVFDDLVNYANYNEGEFRALYEFFNSRPDLGAEWLGSACGAQGSGLLEGDGTCLAAALRLTVAA